MPKRTELLESFMEFFNVFMANNYLTQQTNLFGVETRPE